MRRCPLRQVFERFDNTVFVIEDDVADAFGDASEVQVDGGDPVPGEHVDHGWINLRGDDGDSGHLQSD